MNLTTVCLSGLLLLAGCSSLITEGSSAGAGIAGTAIANGITKNGAIAAGIGLGVQAVRTRGSAV